MIGNQSRILALPMVKLKWDVGYGQMKIRDQSTLVYQLYLVIPGVIKGYMQ
jgi:hypothetical protein